MKAFRVDESRPGCSALPLARRGSILVLSAAALIMVFAFVVFTLDLGYIALTRAQLQSAADAAALGAGLELEDGLGSAASLDEDAIATLAQEAAVVVASAHQAGDRDSVYVDPTRDVRFGKRDWDPSTGTWVSSWDSGPYNMVAVTLHRDAVYEGINGEPPVVVGDEKLPLFFARIFGHSTTSLSISATAALMPGCGFAVNSGSQSKAKILPITLDEPSWANLLNGVGDDDYAYNPETGQVTPGSDGVLEINIYPEAAPDGNGKGNGNVNGADQWTPGNRGTVDLGNPNNSTNDLRRQILEGLNDEDLAYFGGEIRFDQGTLDVNGDPGISAGIKHALEAIIGQTRAMPLFTSVVGQGNNTTYTLVRLVGVRMMAVRLTGGNKYVIVQPAVLIDSTVIPGQATIAEVSIFTPLKLVQ